MDITCIIQARTASERLPGKVLLDLGGKSVIERVIEACEQAERIKNVVVAIPDGDSKLMEHIYGLRPRLDVAIAYGHPTDVLDRYYSTASLTRANHVMRITADEPMIPSWVIDMVAQAYEENYQDGKACYCSNVIRRTFPDGYDAQCFNFTALRLAWENADTDYDKEHVCPWMERSDVVIKNSVEQSVDESDKRLCLDTLDDYIKLKRNYEPRYGDVPKR
jgi:spore coat polysaccharide biosynthesis protein SpsF (cytidylyltransferase family)